MSKDIEVNPDYWGVRCKRCGDTFTQGHMLKKYKARQKSAPPGMWYAKCPTCGMEDFLTDPTLFLKTQAPWSQAQLYKMWLNLPYHERERRLSKHKGNFSMALREFGIEIGGRHQ